MRWRLLFNDIDEVNWYSTNACTHTYTHMPQKMMNTDLQAKYMTCQNGRLHVYRMIAIPVMIVSTSAYLSVLTMQKKLVFTCMCLYLLQVEFMQLIQNDMY